MGTKIPNVRLRGDTYFVRLAVPKELQKAIGRVELTEAVGTCRRDALNQSRIAIARLQVRLDEARATLEATKATLKPPPTSTLPQTIRAFYDAELRADEDERLASGLLNDAGDLDRRNRRHYAAALRRVASGESTGEHNEPPMRWQFEENGPTLDVGERSEADALLGYAADEIAPKFPDVPRADLLRILAAVRLETIDAADRRDGGHPLAEPKHPLLGGSNSLASAKPANPRALDPERSAKPLSELMESFHVERARISPHTKMEHKIAIRMLEEVIGSKAVAEITPQDMNLFKRTLLVTPARYTLRFPRKTIPQAIEANKLRREPFPTLDPVTVQKKWVAHAKSMLKWAVDDAIIPDNPAEKVRVAEANHRGAKTTRQAFDAADLTKLFGPKFAPHGKMGTNEWALLVALFTGARSSSEIARLKLDNVMMDHGTRVFFFEEASKNEHSKRLVPVHSRLVDLGLLEYVETLRKRGETKLFPDWKPEDRVNRWFLRTYKPLVGIESPAKVLHSFRHTLKTALARAGVARDISDLITGHSDQSVASIYIHNATTTQLGSMAQGIERVTFDSVDWTAVRNRLNPR